MEIRLLGPLEVIGDHRRPVVVRAQRPRAVLAILALRAGRPVTIPQLTQALWGEQPPVTAKESIHVFVHELRKAVGAGLVRTQGASYRLELPPGQVDVVRFGRLVDQAHTAASRSELQVAWEGFARALGLWRGTALADFPTEPFAAVERARLEERRLAAVEAQLLVGLALGRHAELAGELEALATEHPLREGLWELLMLARYRAGRQADALAAFQQARRHLVAHGLEPGERLGALQRAILSQDPALDLQPHSPVPRQPPSPTRSPEQPTPSREDPGRLAAAAPASAASGREERRTVTVLVVGAGGGFAGDPEDVRAQLAQVTRQVQGLAGRYGGVVLQGAMGRLLAVFGVVQSHEDDPERAVRAALELRSEVTTGGGPVRVGVATGEAVVIHVDADDHASTTGRQELASVVGDVVSAAASLEAGAPPGGVVVGARTYWATGRVIAYRPAPHASGHGDPGEVHAWEALAPRARTGAYKLTLGDPITRPLVERERELSILQNVLARFLQERQPQLLTVVSEPGLGKTRLVAELGHLVDQAPDLVTWRVGRSAAYGGASLGALAEVVKAHAGILDTDPPTLVHDKLGQAVTEVIEDPDDRTRVTDQLRALIGPTSPQDEARTQPGERFHPWARFLAATAARRPMVVVLEDLHWAEDPLLDFIDFLIGQVERVPLLVVSTARLELLERRPRWGGGKPNTVTISLSPLSPAGTEQLLDTLLGDVELEEDARKALLVASAGNPLYVEEYVRMLTEGAADASLLARRDAPPPLPPTLQQLIAARLDTLSPADKRLLQDSAVLGEVGWIGALATLGDRSREQVQHGMLRLERGQFLHRLRASSVRGEIEYTFRHPLIREVAYQQLLRGERADKHYRVTAWLEQQPDPPVEQLAHHYGQALALDRAARRSMPADVVHRARSVFLDAGDRARTLGAFRTAVRCFRDALELWPQDDPARLEVLFRLGEVRCYAEHAGREELQEVRAAAAAAGRASLAARADVLLGTLATLRGDDNPHPHFERARQAQPQITADNALAHATVASELAFADRPMDALRMGYEFLEKTAGLPIPAERGLMLTLTGASRTHLGRPAGEEECRRGVGQVHAARHPFRGDAWWGLAWSLWWAGRLDRCRVALSDARQACPDQGRMLDWLEYIDAALDFTAGRWERAHARIDRLTAHPSNRHGLVLPLGYVVRGRVRLGRGDLDGAAEDAQTALAGTVLMTGRRLRQTAMALHARVLLARGERVQATAEIDKLLADLHIHPDGGHVAPDLAMVLAGLGRPAAVLPAELPPVAWTVAARALLDGDLDRAADAYRSLGSAVDAADVWMLAASRRAAHGDSAAARAVLADAAEVWRRAGATRQLREVASLTARLDADTTAGAEPDRQA